MALLELTVLDGLNVGRLAGWALADVTGQDLVVFIVADMDGTAAEGEFEYLVAQLG